MASGASPNRTKPLAFITVAVLLGVVLFTGVVEPQLKAQQAYAKRAKGQRLKLIKLQRDMLVKDRVDQAFQGIAALLTGQGTEQQEISHFTRELSDLYSPRKLSVRAVNILPSADKEYYRVMSIRMELSGHMKEVLSLVIALEEYPQPLRIERLDLRAQDRTDHVQATFVISKVVAGQGEQEASDAKENLS